MKITENTANKAAQTVFFINPMLMTNDELKKLIDDGFIMEIDEGYTVRLKDITNITVNMVYGCFYNEATLRNGMKVIINF